MSHTFRLSRRIARLRVPVLALFMAAIVGCDNPNPLDANTTTVTDNDLSPVPETLDLGDDEPIQDPSEDVELAPVELTEGPAAKFAGGIPIGMYDQPTSQFGTQFNGALRNIWPAYLKKELAAIKNRGGRVVLTFTGNHKHYLDSKGHFSMSKWKERVNKFKSVDFNSYINDGTIIGHYLIDEPNDASNWGGKPVTADQVEEMAKYSKQIWPKLPTIVRVHPGYLKTNHKYLDAAWAQYLYRRGPVKKYMDQQVADAKKRGLALVVGLNVLHGGNPNGTKMTPNEIKEWGSALLATTYPCAFISWQHNSYLSTSGVKSAMSYLRKKAQNRSAKSCRAS